MTELSEERVEEVARRHVALTHELVAYAVANASAPKDPELIQRGLGAIAKLTGQPVCSKVVWAESLEAALREHKASEADGIGCRILHCIAHDLASSELLGEAADENTLALQEFCRHVYDTILFDELSVLIPWPSVLTTDERGELHNATGPAVLWPGQAEHFWHGVSIDAHVVEAPETVTADYLRELPAERRRAVCEAIGQERAMGLLGTQQHAESINGLRYELWTSRDDAWLRMESPPLQDGSQPWYVEPVHESAKTCAEALAWRATGRLRETVSFEIET